MDILVVTTLGMIVGFVVGVLISKNVTAAVADLEHRLLAEIGRLESDVHDSFEEVSKDAHAFEARIKALEHNIDVRIANQIVGHQS